MDNIWAGLICITCGVLYLLHVRKEAKKEALDKVSVFTKSVRWQGIIGGLALIVIGIIIVYRKLF